MPLRYGGSFILTSSITLMNIYYKNLLKFFHVNPHLETFEINLRTMLTSQRNVCIRTNLS